MSLVVTLTNQSSTDNLYAVVQGTDNSSQVGAPFFMQSDGATVYYPDNTTGPLAQDVSISVGAVGSSTTVTIPVSVTGGRIWYSYDTQLTFSLNASASSPPGIVEPTVNNTSDANYSITWDFIEFSSDNSSAEVFANISYVDFFSIPVALDVTGASGTTHVSGTDQNGLSTIGSALQAQQANDNVGWNALLVNDANGNLQRILSVNTLLTQGQTNNGFSTYWDNYISSVYSQYGGEQLSAESQTTGSVTATVTNGVLTFSDGPTFAQPASADIWSCSTGPFANSGDANTLALIPVLCAAFNRSTLLAYTDQPDSTTVSEYYQGDPTNYYAKILHSTYLDGNGYAFPYDDLTPANQPNVAGVATDTGVTNFTVTIGGNGAHT